MEGVDYSTDRPSGLCLYANGKRYAGRYFGAGARNKLATRAEVAGLVASGLAVVCYCEGDERDPLSGFNVGRRHAQLAAAGLDAAGIPSDRPIYFALDFDASTAQLRSAASYFNGCASVVGWPRVGAYGGYPQLVWLAQNSWVSWFNQTSSWSGGKWFFGNHLEQYAHGRTVCGARVDLLRSMRVDFGQHPAPRSSGAAPPPATDDSTIAAPWEFSDLIGNLADTFDLVASTVDDAARAIDGWSR